MSRTACLILLCVMPSVCWAGATLTMGFGSESDCTTADNCSGDPNVSMELSDTFSVHNNSGGEDIPPPILYIIGVPNMTGASLFSVNSIIQLSVWDPFDPNDLDANKATFDSTSGKWTYGTDAFGINAPVAGGFYGDYDASSGAISVYDFLGLRGGDASNHFSQWRDFLFEQYGVSASSFGIYVFSIDATLAAKGLIEIVMASGNTVPLYSFIAGYAQSTIGNGLTKVYSSPFTRSAVQTPEPSFLVLLGGGLAGILHRARLRRKRQVRESAVV
jgi:hypothetical protein